ncbi:hypothetical protein ARAM_004869 [Aspergillus rambellii]|uniref:Leucine Rich Repeat domain protein n=1 Tax=Aspergillus rambellii TaxID=308745 RepID=A0A0F8UVL9_9EURO|nr:hypothetical protein ARAM_004869 [Aspergillus rambellii]
MALRGAGKPEQSPNGGASRTYNIRLLLAEREPNTTSQGIAEALLSFPELIYLDLSYTSPARDRMILSALSQLERLQVLKLRGIGLKDNEAELLANAIGLRVRFLDLRNNKLTDMAIRSLLQACFLPPGYAALRLGLTSGAFLSSHDPFAARSRFLSSPVLDKEFRRALTCPLTGRSWVENLPNVGITHLYIADNQITVEGVASLLASTRLHVLDAGTVDTAKYITSGSSSLSPTRAGQQALPGAEKLIPILGTLAKDNLTYLRAHHPICTSTAPQRSSTPSHEFLYELSEENETRGYLELDSTSCGIFELPGDTAPPCELPGSTLSRLSGDHEENSTNRNSTYEDESLTARRRAPIFASEVLEVQSEVDTNNFTRNLGTGTQFTVQTQDGSIMDTSGVCIHLNSLGIIPQCSSPVSMEDSRAQKIQELLAKRPKVYFPIRRNSKEAFTSHLHPSHIPHVETLVLTDVPSHVPLNSPILEYLIEFITACSNEALLATLQAGSDYSLPPGQDRARAEQERARSLFAIRQLVLEITPTKPPYPTKSTAWKSVSAQIGSQKSSTGNRDLEQLWSAAMDDFSFFDETECGIPESDAGKYFPMAALNEKVTLTPDDEDYDRQGISELEASFPPHIPVPRRQVPNKTPPLQPSAKNLSVSPPPAPEVDLVSELAAFRRRKKGEYEQVVRNSYQRRSLNGSLSPQNTLFTGSGSASGSTRAISPSPSLRGLMSAPLTSIAHHVEGHWKGEVKIVRNAAPKGRSGMVDMYGNYFEKGYLYP